MNTEQIKEDIRSGKIEFLKRDLQVEVIKNSNIDFILTYVDIFDMDLVFKLKPNIPTETLKIFAGKCMNYMDYFSLVAFQKLTEDILEAHAQYLNWDIVVVYQKLSEEFIMRMKRYMIWDYLPYYQDHLSPTFIEKHSPSIRWESLSDQFKLSEDFILKFHKRLDKDLLRENSHIERTDAIKVLLKLI